MADSLEAVSFNDSDVVVSQGEQGNDFFIIVEGTAIVTQFRNEGEEPVEVREATMPRVICMSNLSYSGRPLGTFRLLWRDRSHP